MPYDNTCKFLAETYSRDLASWLLGEPIPLVKLEPTELSLEPIRADSLILLQSSALILHVEFQTDPDGDMPFRMADYRLRVYRRFPTKDMHQVVIYLRPTDSPLVYDTCFELSKTRHEFTAIRLWECPVEAFLNTSGLLPFAVLAQGSSPAEALERVAQRLGQILDRREQSTLMATTGILAGLVLDNQTIRQVLRQDIMRESVFYQEIEAEATRKGEQQGLQQGRQEGRQEEAQSLILRLLSCKFGSLSADLQGQIQALPLTQLESLGESLLAFEQEDDLIDWLMDRRSNS